ncbi:glycogen/starch/alpha-glucan phosphorylase [Enterococcus sp. LJL120]
MKITKENFEELFIQKLREYYALDISEAGDAELLNTLGRIITSYYNANVVETNKVYAGHHVKQAYYFSIEFLPGKMLKNNLLKLGLLDTVTSALAEMGIDIEKLANVEKDMALGNGGLGRLASCFMESLAAGSFPGHGNGIRYSYGLFKQRIVDGYQVEIPDDWLKNPNVWEVRKESRAENVRLGGNVYLVPLPNGNFKPVYENAQILRAVPYDTGMIGYHNNTVNNMRLWSVEIPASEEWRYDSLQEKRQFEDLTSVLYPDDSNEYGRLVRLAQEYFFVSAGLQSIINFQKKNHIPMEALHHQIAVHINDTHPAMAVAELMRILIDDEDLSWDTAWHVTTKVMSYTNHTIMQEALETWPIGMVQQVVPRIYQIIEEIDRRFVEEMTGKHPNYLIENTRIIANERVRMANLAIIGSHSVNGVAKLHSELLKNVVLHDFYTLYPEKFNNKTNGIDVRRWLHLSNPALGKVLDQAIGNGWRDDIHQLRQLEDFIEDDQVLNDLAAAKLTNKKHLAQWIFEKQGIEINPEAIFDVHIKRFHGYKRQLLNLLHIMKLYLDLKENPELEMHPRVFMFAGKAAPSYQFAKMNIKCINEAARLINNDPDVNQKLKVIFIEDYNVTKAQSIIPAADVSEQISLASKEASGTSNMKFMLNGALTMATLDGANVEIRDEVGDDNIFIFGLTEKEVYEYYHNGTYNSRELYQNNQMIRRVVDTLIDGTIPNVRIEGGELYKTLVDYNDEYFVLRDFESYVAAQKRLDLDYGDQRLWQQMSLINIAHAGHFSADDTIKQYADDIWHIQAIDPKGSR